MAITVGINRLGSLIGKCTKPSAIMTTTKLTLSRSMTSATYLLQKGSTFTVSHQGKEIELCVGVPFSVRLK